MEIAVTVLKWVILIFLAGVIGQLGKSLTLKLLALRRQKRSSGELAGSVRQALEDPAEAPVRVDEAAVEDAAALKLEKKRRKAELKLAKKARKREATQGSETPDNAVQD
jgi:hypothetical protein